MEECFVARNILKFVRELVDALLAPTPERSLEHCQPQTNSTQLDLPIGLASDIVSHLTDISFDLDTLDFFNAGFPIPFDEVEKDSDY
jgi:hypothetical protein